MAGERRKTERDEYRKAELKVLAARRRWNDFLDACAVCESKGFKVFLDGKALSPKQRDVADPTTKAGSAMELKITITRTY